MSKPVAQKRGLARLIAATGYSMAGLKAAWANEAAFREELAVAAIMIPAAFWVGSTTVEQILLIATVVLVLIVELLNSAIEAAIDRIGTETHDLSGRAKDIGSAAVFLSLLLAGFAWGALLWQRFSGA